MNAIKKTDVTLERPTVLLLFLFVLLFLCLSFLFGYYHAYIEITKTTNVLLDGCSFLLHFY